MTLDTFQELHPRIDAASRLLILDLDHGKANEMGTAQLDAFDRMCDFVESSDEVSCLCTMSRRVSSKGKPIFIAGANVTERMQWSPTQVRAHVRRQRELMVRLRRLPIFTTALTHGATLGWGTEFILTADYAIATATASFSLPETGLGILPGARGTAELASVVGPAYAMLLGCTGESVNASRAQQIGLVQETVDDLDAGLTRVTALALALAIRSPTAIAAFKRALLDGLGRETDARLAIEARAYDTCVASGDAAIGRENFGEILAGRAPNWNRRQLSK